MSKIETTPQDLFEVVTAEGAVLFEGTQKQCVAYVRTSKRAGLVVQDLTA